MKTLGRNADNDLYLEAGGLAILHDADAQCAIIEAILQTQQGELQFDPDRGIDYFGTVLQNPTYIDFWAAQVQSRISDLAFVSEVEDFTYRFDGQSSTLFWSMTVVNTDNERLDLRNKKTVIDGSPGTDLSWNDIYDKPSGTQTALDMVSAMHEEAVDNRELLSSASNLQKAKDFLNRIVFDPNNDEYAKTRLVTFEFSGVPLGTVIDFGNMRLDLKDTGASSQYFAPFVVEISDGTKVRADQTTSVQAVGNKVVFFDSERGNDESGRPYTTQKHTVMKGGSVTVTIKGNITKIWSADPDKPIFLNSKGAPFAYLTGFSVGNRIPLSAIGNGAFAGLNNLQKITWDESGENAIQFGDYAFKGCTSLQGIGWIPRKTESLGVGCFQDCRGISSLEGLQDTLVTEIPDDCFFGCTQIRTVEHLPASTTALGARIFKGCTAIENIDGLPQSVASLGEECFCGCSGLNEILYPPEALAEIGSRCFAECGSLTSLYVSENIASIGSEAFAGCTSLTNIMSDSAAVPAIAADTFAGENPKVYVPAGMLEAYSGDAEWGKFAVEKYGVYQFLMEDVAAGTTLLPSTSSIVSDSIWTIEYGVGDKPQRFAPDESGLPQFTYPSAAESPVVTMHGYVRRIAAASSEAYPFFATSATEEFPNLREIKVSDSPLEFIGDYAFEGCTNLLSVDCGFDVFRPYALGVRAFCGCSSLNDTSWLKPGLGLLVKGVETTWKEDEDGNPVSTEVQTLFPAFGEGCFWKSGISSLKYDHANLTELPERCFSETLIHSLDGIGGEALETLGANCFSECGNLVDISALRETGVKTLPDYCFANCGTNAVLRLDGIEGLSSDGMGGHVFEGSSVLTLMPIGAASEITALSPYMFAGCTGIQNLAGLDGNIEALGEHCFEGCTGLTDFTKILDTGIKTVPEYGFAGCTGLESLIGFWNIASISDHGFAGCTGLIATSGLGPNISFIGSYAFQGCTGLKQVSCIAQNVPSADATAFDGVSVSSLPLYVREDMVRFFASATAWSGFGRCTSRTVKIALQNVGGAGTANIGDDSAAVSGVKVSIDPDEEHRLGMWYVDYGDGSEVEVHYSAGTAVQKAFDGHDYEVRGNYEVTIFGDVTQIWGENTEEIVEGRYTRGLPSEMGFRPFLGELSRSASSVAISSDYLRKIGDFCFFDYGHESIGGNDNSLSLSISMNGDGVVGNYAFAKKTDGIGTIGTPKAFNAPTVGDYAFYNCSLDSSAPFTSVTTAGKAAFALNPGIPDLSGFTALTVVGEQTFMGCSGLKTTTGLESALRIEAEGFRDCTGLLDIRDFNSEFEEIGEGAFLGCGNIATVFMANVNPPVLAEHGFDESVFETAVVYVPGGSEEEYATTPYWTKFANGGADGRVRSRAVEFRLRNVEAGSRTAGYGIVTATGNWVLTYGDGEQSFQYPAGETTLQPYTFATGGDKTVKISGPVTGIRCTSSAYPIFGQSLGRNTWLTEVVSSSAMEISGVGDYLFRGCSSLEKISDTPSIVSVGEFAFADNSSLTDISGLKNTATISQYSFTGCSSLTSLYGLDSVKVIGERAFNGCSSLTTIDGLGTNVERIGEYAFASCPLSEVQMFAEKPPELSATSFYGMAEGTVLYVRTKCISEYAAAQSWRDLFPDIRSRFVEFTLTACPSNMVVVGNVGKVKSDTYWVVDWDAYESNGVASRPGAEATFLPEHVYAISGTHTMRIEGGVTGIYGGEASVTSEEGEPPSQIEGVSFLSLKRSATSPFMADAEHALTRVSRSEHSVLSEVGESAFLHNGRLSAAYLSGISVIGRAAFAYDVGLTGLSLLDSVGTVGEYAFFGCSGLSSVTGLNGRADENGVVGFTIGDYAFGGIPGLTYVQVGVPNAHNAVITDLSFGKFETPQSQKEVYIYVPLESVASYTGSEKWRLFTIASQVLTLTMLHVPSGTTIQGMSETNTAGTARIESDSRWTIDWDDGTRNTMESSQTSFPSHTYVYDDSADSLEKAKWEVVNGVRCRKRIDVSITGSIRTLACQSSANYPFLATEIGRGNPYLVSVSAPETMASLTRIGDFVFQGCSALESVTGFTHVETIGQYAFNGCTELANLGDAESGFSSVTSIGNKAFADCQNLQNLSSFASVLSIGIRAFENCMSLTGTTGMGSRYSLLTQADWAARGMSASFGAYAFDGCSFGAIDMDNYAVPPTIQNSTFPGDPSDVLVFVSSASGVLDAYRAAPVWVRYFENIVVAANITIQFGENEIASPSRDSEGRVVSGTAIYGGNGKLAFSDAYVLIDWGDGTTTQSLSKYSDVNDGWTFPNHLYTTDVRGSVTVKIRGNISRIYTADGGDEAIPEGGTPDALKKPFLALTTFTSSTATDPETGAVVSTTRITDVRKYDYKLQRLSFGNGSRVAKVGAYCFSHCNIGAVEFGKPTAWTEEIKDDNGNVTQSIQHDGTVAIGDCAFWGCGLTTSVTAVDGAISSVGMMAFSECAKIPNVDFLSGCKNIGVAAFKGCIGIERISLPATLLSVTESAFEGCYSVKDGILWAQATDAAALSNGNITIGTRAFYGCTGANNEEWTVTIPSQVHSIGPSAFTKCGMKEFSWGSAEHAGTGRYEIVNADNPDSTAGVFEGCTNLSSVSVRHSLSQIPARAFCNCTSLSSVSLSSGLSTIAPYSFFGCENLPDAVFAAIVAEAKGELGRYAFARCGSLASIEIPPAVTHLGEGCFSRPTDDFVFGNYTSSETFSPGDTPVFHGLSDYEAWLADNYRYTEDDVWGMMDGLMRIPATTGSVTRFSVSWANKDGTLGEGCFMNCRGLEVAWTDQSSATAETTFPLLTQVPDFCFYNCNSLFRGGNLSPLPSTITSFGRFALARTGMSSLGRDGGAGTISASWSPALFLGCSNIESLGVPVDGTGRTDGIGTLFSTIPSTIPPACFYGCTSLYDLNALSTDMTNIKWLREYAFAKCTSLMGRGNYGIFNALSSVTQIGAGCFDGCKGIGGVFKGLKNVTYYPYRCFADIGGVSSISALCSKETGEAADSVTLEGDAFAGVGSISEIALPYNNKVVEVVSANGSSDPFSGIEDKSASGVMVVVPNQMVDKYLTDGYWGGFNIYTSYDGMVPAVQITLSIPPEGGTLRGCGTIIVKDTDGSKVAIDWGDGQSSEWDKTRLDNGTGLNLNSVSHEYAPTGLTDAMSATLVIYGDVVSFNGLWDNEVSAKLENRTVVPIFYTKVIAANGDTPRLAENTWIRDVRFATHELTNIGGGSFGYCKNLQIGTRLPSTIETIGNNAFFGCTQLANLDFLKPSSGLVNHNLLSVGSFCFGYCDALSDYSGFTACERVTSVPIGCFAKTKSVVSSKNLDWLPPNITSIEFGAFQHFCFARFDVPLTKADGTPNPITVGNYAFRYNNSLLDFNSPDGGGKSGILLNLTGTNAFRECKGLTTLEGLKLHSSNTYIPIGTFRQCEKLANGMSNLPDTITEIRDGAFYKTAFTSLSGLPNSVTNIGNDTEEEWDQAFEDSTGGAFGECTKLTSLNGMPSGVRFLGRAAFKGCTALTRLTGISGNITTFGEYCFSKSGLTDLDNIPAGISVIKQNCFASCTSLVDLSGLDLTSISEIPPYCFANCTSLTQIVETAPSPEDMKSLPPTVTRIGAHAFDGCTGILLVKLGRWAGDSATDKITDLEDTDAAPTVFPYSALKGNAGFAIYVPAAAKDAYAEAWCTANRFGAEFALSTF